MNRRTLMPQNPLEPTTRPVSALIARTQFGQILERVSRDRERFVVTRNGKALAVILSIEDFLASTTQPPAALAALQAQAQRSGASGLSLEEIEREVEAVRRRKTDPTYA